MLRKTVARMFGMLALGTICSTSGMASGLDLGTLTQYAVVDLGSGTTFGWNSGPVAGNVLIGNGVTLAASGGGSGVTNGGTVYYDSSVLGMNTLPQLSNPAPPSQLVSGPAAGTVTGTALSEAKSVASYAAGLTPTQTFGSITNSTTITANGTLNVISVGSIQNAPLTISGNANDFFVFNVSGSFNTNQTMTLTGGVTASNILFNFTGTGTVFQTSGGDSLVGTYLATQSGAKFQFSNLNLNGELINTGGNVQLVSGSGVPTKTPFTPPPTVPEPSTLVLLIAAVPGLALLRRKL